MNEYESEPIPGLPGYLPPGERLLWQGKPDWRALALDAFHLRLLALYFAVVIGWHVAAGIHDGATARELAIGLAWSIPLASLGLAILGVLAWAMARTTIYSITDKRVVLRYGIALPMAVNIPFSQIDTADARVDDAGKGDVVIGLAARQRLSWLALWPHARPFRFAQPQPMLRALPDGAKAAAVLGQALSATLPRAEAKAAMQPATAEHRRKRRDRQSRPGKQMPADAAAVAR